jgi:hypothetical protein
MCFLSFVCFTFLRSKQGLKVSELAQGLADDGEACQAMLRVAARVGGLVRMDKTTRACGGDTKG